MPSRQIVDGTYIRRASPFCVVRFSSTLSRVLNARWTLGPKNLCREDLVSHSTYSTGYVLLLVQKILQRPFRGQDRCTMRSDMLRYDEFLASTSISAYQYWASAIRKRCSLRIAARLCQANPSCQRPGLRCCRGRKSDWRSISHLPGYQLDESYERTTTNQSSSSNSFLSKPSDFLISSQSCCSCTRCLSIPYLRGSVRPSYGKAEVADAGKAAMRRAHALISPSSCSKGCEKPSSRAFVFADTDR